MLQPGVAEGGSQVEREVQQLTDTLGVGLAVEADASHFHLDGNGAAIVAGPGQAGAPSMHQCAPCAVLPMR